tara:strand:- start:901 stop:1209 length:309 start_codon:yes stop_codon:yes gene_type:complete
MRLIYKKTVHKKLIELIEKAKQTGRQIEYILISHDDMAELKADRGVKQVYGFKRFEPENPCMAIVSVPHPKGVHYNRTPAMVTHTFFGYKLAEVPKEYADNE